MSKQRKTAPKFASEAEERAFWETHDSSEYLDWTNGQRVVLPNLKPTTKTISLRLPPDTLARWKATGPGWQTRMAEALTAVPLKGS